MMKETIDLFGKILTNTLTALYEPFGFSLLLSFFAMFFYLYAYEPTAAGKGWKSTIVTWYQKFRNTLESDPMKYDEYNVLMGLNSLVWGVDRGLWFISG